jgi:shikimate kinase
MLLKGQVFRDVTPYPLVNIVKPRYIATVVFIAVSGLAVGRRTKLPLISGLSSQSSVSECLVLKMMTANSSETLTTY